jgi:hypothetical protein
MDQMPQTIFQAFTTQNKRVTQKVLTNSLLKICQMAMMMALWVISKRKLKNSVQNQSQQSLLNVKKSQKISQLKKNRYYKKKVKKILPKKKKSKGSLRKFNEFVWKNT